MARKRLRPKEDDSQVAEVEVEWVHCSPVTHVAKMISPIERRKTLVGRNRVAEEMPGAGQG